MKRILLIALILTMVLGLFAGCKKQENEEAFLGDLVGNSTIENAPAGDDQPQQENNSQGSQGQVQTPQDNDATEDPDAPVSNQPNPEDDKDSSSDQGNSVPDNKGEISEPNKGEQQEEPEKEEPEKEEPEKEQPEEEAAPVEKDYSDYLTVVSYNIKSLLMKKEGVVEVLRQLDGDIVGLQEVDYFNARSDNSDQTEFLAKKLGYPYYYFVNCMGDYGTAILSRYPMKVTEHEYSNYVGSEVRKFGRAEIDVDGKTLIFYNTHLTTGTWEQTGIQFKELLNYAYKEKEPTVVLGDFNLTVAEMKKRVFPKLLFPLHGGMEMTHKLPAISYDNIFVKNIDDYYWEVLDEETDSGVGLKVLESDASDHNPIYTYIKLS